MAAVSAGSDSTALLELLVLAARRLPFHLDGVTHVHHRIRGGEADEDARFCENLAARHEIPCYFENIDVPALARSEGLSLEAAGRKARYDFFDRLHREKGGLIATGHTADDRIETLFLKLQRGEGPGALAGIRPRRKNGVIRPLLPFLRCELRAWLVSRGTSWREDESNSLPSHSLRSSVRALVTPAMTEVFGPDFPLRASSTLDRLLEDNDFLDRQAETLILEAALPAENALDASILRRSPIPLVRRALHRFASDQGLPALPGRLVGRILTALHSSDRPRSFSAGEGSEVRIDGTRIRVATIIDRPASPMFEHNWCGEETLEVPEASGRLRIQWIRGSRHTLLPSAGSGVGWTLILPVTVGRNAVEKISAFDLTVRNRRAGDRFRPLGCAGSGSLKDLFIDRKIPRERRAGVPVLTSRSKVIWVPGVAIAEAARLPEGELEALKLTWEENR